MSNITFVTGFFKIYDDNNSTVKKMEDRITLFKELAATGIKLSLFICPEYKDIINELPDNVKIVEVLTLYETNIGKLIYNCKDIELPNNRTIEKDTIDYIVLMNVKTELVKKASDSNPWNTEYFSWIDFNIAHVFKNKQETYKYLNGLNNYYIKTDKIVIPGCWDKTFNIIDYLKNNIVWRFCGGVFIGNKENISHFYNLYLNYLHVFINITKKIVWEVNFWCWLENNSDFPTLWYKADHNDSIVIFPKEIIFEI